ncbi:phage tail spike protein [Bacillus toyonensis]|uniref:phage tail spike protein n=1 Tax=Bacillus toyonensis TaxID=155322 RepID=UPI003467B437
MIVLYEPNETDFTHNGIGILDKYIYGATVEEVLNGLFVFKFSYPLFAPYGNEINGMSIIKVPTPDGDQLFRVASYNPSMGELTAQCYHIFYDLTENLIEDIYIDNQTGNTAMDRIATGCQYKHPFTFSSDLTKVASSRIVRKNPVEIILDNSQENAFVNRWGGELKRDNFDVKMLRSRGRDRGVVIRHKKDLLGYEGVVDWKSPVTRIMPQGFNGLFLPEKYVDSPLINKYPHPKIRIVEFKDIKAAIGENAKDEDAVPLEEAYKLLRKASKDMFDNQHVDQPKGTYNVSFQELSQTEEYKDYAVLQSVYMGDIVTVEHKEDGIDVQAKVNAYKYDPIKKEYINLTIGNFKESFADIRGKIDQMKDDLSDMNVSILEAAKEHATNLINSGFGGHVRNYPDKILIMDTKDEMTAKKVWQWNINGLGYSSTGINGPYGLAMTMDGGIVADFITTGILNAALLKAGTIKGQKGNMTIDLDNDKMKIANGAISILRPDGYEVISDGMAKFDLTVDEHEPMYIGEGVYVDGWWWVTTMTVPRECQVYTIRHQARYLKLHLGVFVDAGGTGRVEVAEIRGGVGSVKVAERTFTNGQGGTEASAGITLSVDLGVPDGKMKSFILSLGSVGGGERRARCRKIRVWLEG